jgi:hypothetical protein
MGHCRSKSISKCRWFLELASVMLSWNNQLYSCHSIVWLAEALCYKPDVRGNMSQWGNWIFWMYLFLPVAYGPGIDPVPETEKEMPLGSRVRPTCKADNLTAICVPIVYTMWDPQQLTILIASTACTLYFTFIAPFLLRVTILCDHPTLYRLHLHVSYMGRNIGEMARSSWARLPRNQGLIPYTNSRFFHTSRPLFCLIFIGEGGSPWGWSCRNDYCLCIVTTKNAWKYTHNPAYCVIIVRCLIKHRDKFTYSLFCEICSTWDQSGNVCMA